MFASSINSFFHPRSNREHLFSAVTHFTGAIALMSFAPKAFEHLGKIHGSFNSRIGHYGATLVGVAGYLAGKKLTQHQKKPSFSAENLDVGALLRALEAKLGYTQSYDGAKEIVKNINKAFNVLSNICDASLNFFNVSETGTLYSTWTLGIARFRQKKTEFAEELSKMETMIESSEMAEEMTSKKVEEK